MNNLASGQAKKTTLENDKSLIWCVDYGFSTGSMIHSQLFLTENGADNFYNSMEHIPYRKKYQTRDIWGFREWKLANDNGKAGFVANELTSLLRKIDNDIERANYEIKSNSEEFVYVRYKNGFEIKVCVSADNFAALSRDVLRQI